MAIQINEHGRQWGTDEHYGSEGVRIVVRSDGKRFIEGNQDHISPSGRRYNHNIDIRLTDAQLEELAQFLNDAGYGAGYEGTKGD